MHASGYLLVFLVVGVVGVVCLVKSSGQATYETVESEAAKAEQAVVATGNNVSKAVVQAYHTLEVDFEKAEQAVVAVGNEIAGVLSKLHITDGCVCAGTTCGCCSHIEEEQIHLNATACVNVTYLSQDYGISITATINKYTIYNETVSAKNPPPICVGAPYVKDMADLCIRLHDIEATRRSLKACAAAEATLKHIRIAHFELGCFAVGKPGTAEEGDDGVAQRYRVVPADKPQGGQQSTAAPKASGNALVFE